MTDDRFHLPYERIPNPGLMDVDLNEWPLSDHVGIFAGIAITTDDETFALLCFGFGLDLMDNSVACTAYFSDETGLRLLRKLMCDTIDDALRALREAKRG